MLPAAGPPPPVPISDTNELSWPRRAAKACSSCRRDKTRCDGERPCAGCVKKGYGADQCIDGCLACRRARARCEGGTPCIRCRETQTECEEQQPSLSSYAISESLQLAQMRSVTRDRGERAKLACQGCRRDNKKCDNQRPCSRCVARSEECIHVGRGPKLVTLRCQACRQENKRCEDARPCHACVLKGEPCVTLPRRGSGPGTRVKACSSCRQNKTRCDGVRPCTNCARRGLECRDRPCRACMDKGIEEGCTHQSQQMHDITDLHLHQPPHEHVLPTTHAPPGLHPQIAPVPSMHPMSPGPGPTAGPSAFAFNTFPIVNHYEPPPMSMPSSVPSTNSLPAAPYYPIIDPNIDRPPPHLSVQSPSGFSGSESALRTQQGLSQGGT